MADKFFLKSGSIYKATSKRLQNDIEITGAEITEAASRIQEIDTGGSPFKTYVALLSQGGAMPPEAIVMNGSDSNYLGDIEWTYDSEGYYIATKEGGFPLGKTYMTVGNLSTTQTAFVVFGNQNQPDSVFLLTSKISVVAGELYNNNTDAILDNCPIEIRVYQ